MNAAAPSTATRAALALAAGTCSLLLVLAPMAAPALVPLLALSLVAAVIAQGLRLRDLARDIAAPSRAFAGLSLLGLYLLANASWSPVPAFAFKAAGFYFVLIVMIVLVVRAAPRAAPSLARAWSGGLCAGLTLGALGLLIEVLADQPLVRFLISYLPVFLESRHAVLKDGWVAHLPAYRPNRATLVIALSLWPALLIVFAAGFTRWKKAALYAAFFAGIVAIGFSEHETSKMAVAGSAIIFLAGRFSLAAARGLVVAGWFAATALVVPIASYAYAQGLHRVPWLPYSARDRIVIWQTTAEHVARAPILGAGIGAARAHEELTRPIPRAGPTKRLSLHSHNAYLQTWFEAGAVGAGLLFAAGLLVVAAIGSAPLQSRSFLYAAFAASALMAATSYSIWAPWFMACLAFVPVLAAVGIGLIKGDHAPEAFYGDQRRHEPQLRN